MKKISKKLSLHRQVVRVLSGSELEGAAGGAVAEATTTVHSIRRETAMIVCVTGGVHTAPCRYTL